MLYFYELRTHQKTGAVLNMQLHIFSEDIESMDAPDLLPAGSTCATYEPKPFAYPSMVKRDA